MFSQPDVEPIAPSTGSPELRQAVMQPVQCFSDRRQYYIGRLPLLRRRRYEANGDIPASKDCEGRQCSCGYALDCRAAFANPESPIWCVSKVQSTIAAILDSNLAAPDLFDFLHWSFGPIERSIQDSRDQEEILNDLLCEHRTLPLSLPMLSHELSSHDSATFTAGAMVGSVSAQILTVISGVDDTATTLSLQRPSRERRHLRQCLIDQNRDEVTSEAKNDNALRSPYDDEVHTE